mmetsp:Transcript_61093/g.189787  ORF Transcript_61093/g.189787 Transcript_61093/m.189787 type:complete len:85 (-) Transcript_61093:673-927(-)
MQGVQRDRRGTAFEAVVTSAARGMTYKNMSLNSPQGQRESKAGNGVVQPGPLTGSCRDTSNSLRVDLLHGRGGGLAGNVQGLVP